MSVWRVCECVHMERMRDYGEGVLRGCIRSLRERVYLKCYLRVVVT